jgi:hypothetical protein
LEAVVNNGVPQLKATRVGNDWPKGWSADGPGGPFAFDGRMRVDVQGTDNNGEGYTLTAAQPTLAIDWPTTDDGYVPIALVSVGVYTYAVNDPDNAWGWDLMREDRVSLPAGVDHVATVWAANAQLGVFDADHVGGTPGAVYIEYHNDGNQPLDFKDATGTHNLAGGEMLRVEWPNRKQAIAWTATAVSDGHVVNSGNLMPPS